MRKWIVLTIGAALVPLLVGVALAQMGWGSGYRMGPDYGMGPGYGPCPDPAMRDATPGVTEEKAREIAEQYAEKYLKGYTVDKVLPFTGMRGWTAYSVELKGPKDEVQTLHVNPWGGVMPFGGPARRAS